MKTRRQKTGMKSYAQGLWAEKFAELILRFKGYRILGQRIRTPAGEVDLLAAKNKTLVIVEVKKRGDDYAAASAISPHQHQRLMAAANHLLARHQGFEHLRFDAIMFAAGSWPRHIRNVF